MKGAKEAFYGDTVYRLQLHEVLSHVQLEDDRILYSDPVCVNLLTETVVRCLY